MLAGYYEWCKINLKLHLVLFNLVYFHIWFAVFVSSWANCMFYVYVVRKSLLFLIASNLNMQQCILFNISTQTHTHTHTYIIHTYTCMHTNIHTYICMYIHTCIHTCITHTYIHAYICTYQWCETSHSTIKTWL